MSYFTFPKEWDNDERMVFLFAPFPPNHVLSEKVCFWKELVLSSSKQLDQPTFTLAQLKIRFTRKGLIPACLSKVVEQMEANHVIQKLEDWNSAPANSWSDWAKQLTSQSVSYMWQRVVGKPEDEHVKYIIIGQIKVGVVCVCECVCACACACVRVCVCVCVCACAYYSRFHFCNSRTYCV